MVAPVADEVLVDVVVVEVVVVEVVVVDVVVVVVVVVEVVVGVVDVVVVVPVVVVHTIDVVSSTKPHGISPFSTSHVGMLQWSIFLSLKKRDHSTKVVLYFCTDRLDT